MNDIDSAPLTKQESNALIVEALSGADVLKKTPAKAKSIVLTNPQNDL